MRILLDANLSWRLIKLPEGKFEIIEHVDKISLPVPAKDIEIWDYARGNDSIIITNDEDFLNLLMSRGFPPKIILLRTSNQSTKDLVELLFKHKSDFESLYSNDQLGVLELYSF